MSEGSYRSGDEEEGEEEEKFDIKLETQKVKDLLKEGLTTLDKTADNSSYAFIHLNYSEKELENLHLSLHSYPHVRYLNLSQNLLTQVTGIEDMHSLLRIDLSQNQITNADFLGYENRLVYVQTLNLSQNKLKAIPDVIYLPRLKTLNISDNEIDSLEGVSGHQSLKLLEARKNHLRNLIGLDDLPRLEEVYLAENGIDSFEGLETLPKLRRLHLRMNQIKIIPDKLPVLPALQSLNIRENQIENIKETEKLLQLVSLHDLNLMSNPYDEEFQDARKELIMLLCLDKSKNGELRRHIPRVNKEPLDQEEIVAIIEELKQIIIEEEEKKKEEEAERKIKEEEERRLREEEGDVEDVEEGQPENEDNVSNLEDGS